MFTNNKVHKAILYSSLLVFISFVVYILYINQEVFYTAHNHSEFLYGSPFFNTLMSKPFGLLRYIGAWLTMFFCKPAIGSAILAAIWIMTFFVGIKAFKLKGHAMALMLIPIACLLTSVVDLGYWIYISTIRGYWFSQSLGYLILLLLLCFARATPRKWHAVWYVIGFCLYPFLGWFALLFILCLVLSDKISWREGIGIAAIFSTSIIWRALLYTNMKLESVTMAGFPIFENPSDKTPYLSSPFWILAISSIIIILLSRYLSKWFVPVLCTIAGMVFTFVFMFRDQNYIDEMRMVRYAETDNWKEILNIASESKKPTTSMVMLKNIALMNEGGLLDRSFKMGNDCAIITNPDTLHVTLLEIASPIVYYNYGLINEAIRLNFECGVQSGLSPLYLKMLSRCTKATGEDKQSEHYATMVQHLPFYGDWQPAPVTKNVQELHHCYADELSGVENSDSYIVNSLSVWNDSTSKLASEQAVLYSMLRSDSQRFWPALRNYVKLHMNEEFPLHAMEAYIMYMDKAPEEKRMMLPVKQEVYDRYKQFWETLQDLAQSGMGKNDIKEKMQLMYGDTYWYFNIFGRKIY